MKKLNTLAWTLSLTWPAYSVQAIESQMVHGPTGVAIFELRFFNVGDGPFMGDEDNLLQSTWNLTTKQKDKITASVNQWAQVIQPELGELPATVNIGTFDKVNATGYSQRLSNKKYAITQLQAAVQGKENNVPLVFGSHAQLVMGLMDFENEDYVPSQIPRTGEVDLAGVTFHELAHGIGISSDISDIDGKATPQFHKTLNGWSQHLHDDNDNPAQPNQTILCSKCETDYDPGAFDVRKDQGYFKGQHVNEVLAGSLPGVPVRMLYYYDDTSILDDNYMSHSELNNSMMSHQLYRNYATFMEAELAVLQDLNYTIDRRNFFGYSIYNDGLHLVNTNGFFKRNDTGAEYLDGQYNPSTLGLGLHIYGSHNQISQQADLLSNGAGGAGIRVDGIGNTIIVESDTRIYADGENGRGILFAYGKEHNLVQRGDIQALGKNGVAVSFDFGNNQLANQVDYRGSYIHTKGEKPAPLLDELNGALVNQFDLTGRLAAEGAAIYLAPNALVKNINIMQGAQIQGNIYSDYAQFDENDQARLTQVSFGQLPDENGRAKDQADNQFKMRYDDNIEGINNLALVARGGQTSLNGENKVHSLRVAPFATIAGSARYTLNETASFVNEGTVAPGNDSFGQIDIVGNYEQTRTGTLLMDVDGQARHDRLTVSGNAHLDGQLVLDAQPGWYEQGWHLLSKDLVQTGSLSGEFNAISARLASPTLSLKTNAISAGVYQLSIARQPNSYSQYAINDNERAVGKALYHISSLAQTDIQPLYRTLDFSATDGSTVLSALGQLSPAPYSAMAASSLARERQITDLITTRSLSNTETLLGTQWQGFALPFGERASQNPRDYLVGYKSSNYGILFGAEKRGVINNDLTVGLHGAVSRQRITLDSPLQGKGHSTALNLGVQIRFTPDLTAGPYAFGSAHLGWQDSKLNRHLRINDYAASYQSDWHAWSGTITAGGGYRWALSESISAGPIAKLNYTTLARPAITESGDATALNLDSHRFHALRSSLGLSAHVNQQTKTSANLKGELQVTWDRELLQKDFVQNTSFGGYPTVSFTNRNKLIGRDSLGLRAGMSYEINKKLAIEAGVSTSLFKSGYSSMEGNVSARWRF